jgi:hypothetical protein
MMTKYPTIHEMRIAPLLHLIKTVRDLEVNIIYNNWRWFQGARDDFSWVYGLSEIEIEEFGNQYSKTKNGIINTIEHTENDKLRLKLTNEYRNFPHLDYKEFVLKTDNLPWFYIKAFKSFTTIKKTVKFKDILAEIRRTCERMLNYYENVG